LLADDFRPAGEGNEQGLLNILFPGFLESDPVVIVFGVLYYESLATYSCFVRNEVLEDQGCHHPDVFAIRVIGNHLGERGNEFHLWGSESK
jgi:hypothetical protein